MARLTIEVEIPGYTVKDLIDLVVANDDTSGEEPIAPEYVKASDVLTLLYLGEADFETTMVVDEMTD